MKITLIPSLILLLFASISQPMLGAEQEVVDTSGKILTTAANYYIVPFTPFTICGFVSCFNVTGSISLDTTSESCPLDVIVLKSDQGLPLMFTPINPNEGVVRVSTDLNIRFVIKNSAEFDDTRCPEYSKVWKLDRLMHVTTGGVVGHPGPQTLGNWFRIEEYDGAYKMVYCPTVHMCPSCKHVCGGVGMIVDKDRRMRLGLNDLPFKIKFQKA